MTQELVVVDIEEDVAVLTLNRPQQLNALDESSRRALLLSLVAAAHDEAVKVLILTGSGRGFCVGQDLTATHELDDCHDCVERTYNPLVKHLAGLDKPVIAAVNGPAVGAGMALALGCDMVLMSYDSFFSCSFGKVGLIPDSGASYYLSRLLGHQRAFEIALSGRRILPSEAIELGLANRVVAPDQLLAEAKALAAQLAQASPKAVMLTKQLLRRGAETSLSIAIGAEALAQGVCGHTPEHQTLRNAILNRATP